MSVRVASLVLGLAVVGLTVADAAVALTQAGGGGHRRAARLRGALRGAFRRGGGRTPGLGWAMASTIVLGWLAGAWVGWGLAFCGAEHAVVGPGGEPAATWARFHYAGSSLATLGVGPYAPGLPAWAFLTDLTAFTGFALVSAVVAFVAQAVAITAARDAWVLRVRLLGDDAAAISDALGRSDAGAVLRLLASELAPLAAAHRRAPFLYDVGAHDREGSFACALDDLCRAVDGDDADAAPLLRGVRRVLESRPGAADEPLVGALAAAYASDLGWSPVGSL